MPTDGEANTMNAGMQSIMAGHLIKAFCVDKISVVSLSKATLSIRHEVHETCHSVMYYFMKKIHILVLAASAFYLIW